MTKDAPVQRGQWIRVNELDETHYTAAQRFANLISNPIDKHRLLGDYIETGMVWQEEDFRSAEAFAHTLNPIDDLVEVNDD
jgi:hypothetical protein